MTSMMRVLSMTVGTEDTVARLVRDTGLPVSGPCAPGVFAETRRFLIETPAPGLRRQRGKLPLQVAFGRESLGRLQSLRTQARLARSEDGGLSMSSASVEVAKHVLLLLGVILAFGTGCAVLARHLKLPDVAVF